MALLILESLGSTELLFILVMALVFFGPRKLPQLSRSLGKNLAEFRRASEDFKRTWEKEVNLEEIAGVDATHSILPENKSSLNADNAAAGLQQPTIEAVMPDDAIARHQPEELNSFGSATSENASEDVPEIQPTRKHDWL